MKNKISLLLFFLILPILLKGQSINELNKLTPEEKLFGLSKIWKEVEYNYAYFEKIGSNNWDSLYISAIKTVLATKNDYEYLRELQKFIANLKDGHCFVRRFPNINLWTTLFYDYYIEFGWIDNTVVVTRVNTEKKDEIPIGSELIEINSLPTMEYINKNVIPIISASTNSARLKDAVVYLFDGLKDMEYSVKIKKPNKEICSINLKHDWPIHKSFPKIFYPPLKPKDDILFKWINNDIALLTINTLKDSSSLLKFKNYLPDLYNAKKLIIDLRENSGGNTEIGLEIFKYFTNDSVIFGPKMRARIHISLNKANGVKINKIDEKSLQWEKDGYLDYKNALYTEFEYEPYKNNLKEKKVLIPIYILIGANTISAGEDFLVLTKEQKHIKTVGENTAGSTGSIYRTNLPKGGMLNICTLQSYFSDGSEYVGVGIVPDIEVKMTINGLINLKDEVLENAIKLLTN